MQQGSAESRIEARMERKISFAKERDTRVVLARTNDTHKVLDIVRSADRGIRIIRANLLLRYSVEEVVPLLEEYKEAVQKLHEATQKICALTGVTYRPPKGFEFNAIAGDGEDAKLEKMVDSRMEMAYSEENKKKVRGNKEEG